MKEARCSECGEYFNPGTSPDLLHVERSSGERCGGQGLLPEEWFTLIAAGRSFVTPLDSGDIGEVDGFDADDWEAGVGVIERAIENRISREAYGIAERGSELRPRASELRINGAGPHEGQGNS